MHEYTINTPVTSKQASVLCDNAYARARSHQYDQRRYIDYANSQIASVYPDGTRTFSLSLSLFPALLNS